MRTRGGRGKKIPKFCGRHIWMAPYANRNRREERERERAISLGPIYPHVWTEVWRSPHAPFHLPSPSFARKIDSKALQWLQCWVKFIQNITPFWRVRKPFTVGDFLFLRCTTLLQGGCGGWPTGKGKKVSKSQACCLAQLCLAAANLFPFPVGHPPHPPCSVVRDDYIPNLFAIG